MATSLETLAPYLPYGIEIEVMPPHGFRAKLIGITPPDPMQNPVHVRDLSDGMRCDSCWLYEDCLPILRPFSALCEPLEDGTVPAVALAYMIFDGMVGDGDPVHAGFDHFGNVVVAAGAVRVMSITPDWIFCPEDGNHAGPAEYRKLLEWHFAVGLEPGQYIEKVSSAAPIDKNTAL